MSATSCRGDVPSLGALIRPPRTPLPKHDPYSLARLPEMAWQQYAQQQAAAAGSPAAAPSQ